MNTPTHEEVAQCAHKLWHTCGCPEGRDTTIWLEAEREIMERWDESHSHPAVHPVEPTPGESPGALAQAASTAQQKKEARAPIAPRIMAPTAKPPESGKPLWNQPHSS